MVKKIQPQTKNKVVPINYVREFFLALVSNKSKIFSQKKIFTLVAFLTMLIINIVYLYKNIQKISALDFLQITALWLAYGGYNSYQNYRDRKLHIDDAASSESSDTTLIDNDAEGKLD